jgi:hypothetical protein
MSTLWAEEEEKHYEEGRSDLAQQMKPWAYSYSQKGGQGAALEEQTTRLLQLGLWTCSYCRADGHDLTFPPERRCSDVIHLRRPWRQVREGKTLDEVTRRKMMRRRKIIMRELGFLPSPNMLYL